jgi:integrase
MSVQERAGDGPSSTTRCRCGGRAVVGAGAGVLAIKPGLVPHGLRHGHKTWMIEDDIPEVLQHDRLGHEMDGIKSTYSHVSQSMRENLKRVLQTRWEAALDERAKLSPRSPVGVLDELLAPGGRDNRR